MSTTANAPAVSAVPAAEDQRERFYQLIPELLRARTPAGAGACRDRSGLPRPGGDCAGG